MPVIADVLETEFNERAVDPPYLLMVLDHYPETRCPAVSSGNIGSGEYGLAAYSAPL
jgi:hypothetical protein